MGDIEPLPRVFAARRILEGIIATVLGGLIVWSVTSSMSPSARTAERNEAAVALDIQLAPNGSSSATSTTGKAPEPRIAPPLASIAGSREPPIPPLANGLSVAAPIAGESPTPRVGVGLPLLPSSPALIVPDIPCTPDGPSRASSSTNAASTRRTETDVSPPVVNSEPVSPKTQPTVHGRSVVTSNIGELSVSSTAGKASSPVTSPGSIAPAAAPGGTSPERRTPARTQADSRPLVSPTRTQAESPPLASPAGLVGLTIPPTLNAPLPARSPPSEVPPAEVRANRPHAGSIPRQTAAVGRVKGNLLLSSVSSGSVLLYEDFSHFRAGESTDWGPNTFVKVGRDHRNWLVSSIAGTHPVGRRIRLPNAFYFECRYSAYTPEVTQGILGWWKEPVSTTISFVDGRGAKHVIKWVIKCGNDVTRLNPLGSSSLYAKKYYHSITLPDGTANEVGLIQPAGLLRIERDNKILKVFLDNQAVVAGTMSQTAQLVGFGIGVVRAKNGALSFTDFRIAR